MKAWFTSPKKSLTAICTIAWLSIFLCSRATIIYQQGYRLNTGHSYPPGIYQLSNVSPSLANFIKGDLVLFCPPSVLVVKIALSRGYLDSGRCKSGSVPIIKRIAALEHDNITLDNLITINGRTLPDTTILSSDLKLRPLQAYTYQNMTHFTMPPDTVFLYSEHAPKMSFDSRYFGFVALKNIQGSIHPVWVYNKSILNKILNGDTLSL